MKSVNSVAELNRQALGMGASVSVGNTRFNSGMQTATARAPIAPAPTPAPPPAPVAPMQPIFNIDLGQAARDALAEHQSRVDAVLTQVEDKVQQGDDRLRQMLASALAALPKPVAVPNAPAARTWRLQVVRTEDGLLDYIDAIPNP